MNPYAYVSNNPLSASDPLGLYQIDIHYYTTFFLGIMAGVDKDTARRIALAAQYIDDNELTRPLRPSLAPRELVNSIAINQSALVRYHFVQNGFDVERTLTEELYSIAARTDMESYITRRVKNPKNPQLDRLLAASIFAKSDPNANCYSRAQLFGEYLHTFQDTFAHRDEYNSPYKATQFTLGVGHGLEKSDPDYTYNHNSFNFLNFTRWRTNEARTLQMQKEVFAKLKAFSNPANMSENFHSIQYTLETFNSFQANDSNLTRLKEKVSILNNALSYMSYKGFDMTFGVGKDAYDEADAKRNRNDALRMLKPEDYVGTILPRGTASIPGEKK